jgi:hypothetical protein
VHTLPGNRLERKAAFQILDPGSKGPKGPYSLGPLLPPLRFFTCVFQSADTPELTPLPGVTGDVDRARGVYPLLEATRPRPSDNWYLDGSFDARVFRVEGRLGGGLGSSNPFSSIASNSAPPTVSPEAFACSVVSPTGGGGYCVLFSL